MNMKLVAVVTPPSIYRGYSTRKISWQDKFAAVSMKNYGLPNVRKYMDIKNGEHYITSEDSLVFCSLDKNEITSS